MTIRTKICGIRSEQDLNIAAHAGAHALGFISGVTHQSEDALTAEVAGHLIRLVPPYISTVLVTHLTSPGDILGLAREVGADQIQVHGLVDHETLATVWNDARGRFRVIGVVHVEGEQTIDAARDISGTCDAVHLDSRTADRLGGTGLTRDWRISKRIVDDLRSPGIPVILSGGLNPLNVVSAVSAVQPFAVDANSGLEDSLGNKRSIKCRRFVSLAQCWTPLSAREHGQSNATEDKSP